MSSTTTPFANKVMKNGSRLNNQREPFNRHSSFVTRKSSLVTQNMIPKEFEPLFKRIFEEQIAFNKVVGIKLLSLDPLVLGLENRYELQGNTWQGFLHGGVIATTLDVAGGVAVAVEILKQNPDAPIEEIGQKMTRVGTIDLRIDYLRPGVGESFTATAETMRHGSRITVIRMKFYNEKETLLAVGTGTYVVG